MVVILVLGVLEYKIGCTAIAMLVSSIHGKFRRPIANKLHGIRRDSIRVRRQIWANTVLLSSTFLFFYSPNPRSHPDDHNDQTSCDDATLPVHSISTMKSRRRLNHIIVLALWLLNYETTANVCNASQSHNNDQMKSDAKECGIGNSSSPNKGAYQWDPEKIQPCSIVQMTWKEIKTKFGSTGLPPMYPHPLVIKEGNRNTKFRSSCQKDQILDFFPSDFPVTLSSSNSFSEHRRTIPLRQYMFELEEQVQQLPNQLSNETWYLFGETYSEQWKQFLSNYELPICEACQADSVALSFGIGNRGSGVQWHVHGPGFSEAIVGRKRRFLFVGASFLVQDSNYYAFLIMSRLDFIQRQAKLPQGSDIEKLDGTQLPCYGKRGQTIRMHLRSWRCHLFSKHGKLDEAAVVACIFL